MNSTKPPEPCLCLIVDVVRSRREKDQGRLLARFQDAARAVESAVDSLQPLRSTVGDEMQAAYADVSRAVRATLHLSLSLAPDLRLRCGYGWGGITLGADRSAGQPQSGPGWWSARAALEEAKARESRQGWPRGVHSAVAPELAEVAPWLDSFLVLRDQILSRMDAVDVRIASALLLGEKQRDVVDRLSLDQSAVSRRQSRNGPAALLWSQRLLEQAIEATTNRTASGTGKDP